MKKANLLSIALVFGFQFLALGCYEETSYIVGPSLDYSVQEEGWASATLSIDLSSEAGPYTAWYGGQDYPFKKLLIEKAELDEIITFFPLVTSTVVPAYLPDCEVDPVICLAVKAVQGVEVFGHLDLKTGPSTFFFRSPPNLTIEAAQLIVALEKLRARVIAEGEPLPPPAE